MPELDTSFDVEAFEAEAKAERRVKDKPMRVNREALFALLEKRMPEDIIALPGIQSLLREAKTVVPDETHGEYWERVRRLRIELFGEDKPRRRYR